MNPIATKNRTDVSEKVESRAAPSGALVVSPHERIWRLAAKAEDLSWLTSARL